MIFKTYKDLIRLPTFEERFEYLKLGGFVGEETFGFGRYLNQNFYRSREWKLTRRDVIARDQACDLAIQGREIFGRIIVHHINPISLEDIEEGNDSLFDLNNLITMSHNTSNAVHYGDASLLFILPPERRKGDTRLWPKIQK